MTGLIIWSQNDTKKENGYKILYNDVEVEDAAGLPITFRRIVTNIK
jgi:hypothetical protein